MRAERKGRRLDLSNLPAAVDWYGVPVGNAPTGTTRILILIITQEPREHDQAGWFIEQA